MTSIELGSLQPNLRHLHSGTWANQEDVIQVQRFNEFRTVDWMEDELSEHRKRLSKTRNTSSWRDRLHGSTLTWLMLTAMGCAIGLIAGCLNIITAWLTSVRFGHCSLNWYLSRQFCCWGQGETCDLWKPWTPFFFTNYLLYVGISVLFALVAAVLVKLYAPSAAGSGISEIKCIVSGFVMEGFLGWLTLFIKSLGLPLAIALGLSVGKEGPSVHYAVCVGNNITKLVDRYKRSALKGRTFLTATAAAGVAVAFGSPMGGVLFSIEEISNVFELAIIWKSYFCSLVAVTTLSAMNPFRTGQLVLFEVTYDTNWHYFEIPLYILIGVFGGVYGIIVSKYNIRVVSFRKRFLKNYAVREVVILALLTTSFSFFNEYLQLDMTESMEVLFRECSAANDHPLCHLDSQGTTKLLALLLFATAARIALTIITYGCKVPAGIFVPSMAAGATFGRALGILVDKFYRAHSDSLLFLTCPATGKCIIPGTYAFLGAAAALSGITHLTVTVVIIMFELTGALRYIIPTMIVVAITKSINDRWGKGGIADQMIKFNGLPFIDAKEEFSFGTTVESCMTKVLTVFPTDGEHALTIAKIRETLTKTNCRGFPVIKSPSDPKVVGFVLRTDAELALLTLTYPDDTKVFFDAGLVGVNLASIVNTSPITVKVDVKLEYLLEIFVKLGPRYVLVQTSDGALAGIVTQKDILRYEHTLHHIHNHDDEQLRRYDMVEQKVWDILVLMNVNFRKNMGKLFFNDDLRFMRGGQ